MYFYILLHFLLYDRGSINIYFYINIVLWYSHISVLRYLFFKHYTFLFLLFWCISCCTTLGPSISCSCVECLPLRLSDQIRTDDHMMIKWQCMVIFIWTCRIMVIMFIWQYDHQQPATQGLRPNTDWWSYDDQYGNLVHFGHDDMMIFIKTCKIMIIMFIWQYDHQQAATQGLRPNTHWWSYDDQYRSLVHCDYENMMIFIWAWRIMIIMFMWLHDHQQPATLYDKMMINKWPWWSLHDDQHMTP